MNRVILTGKIIKDAKLYKGTAKYTVAVRDDDRVDFIDCSAFNEDAKFAIENFRKGAEVTIEGAIRNNSYMKNGGKVYRIEIHPTYQTLVIPAPKNGVTVPEENTGIPDAYDFEMAPPMPEIGDETLPFED